MSTTVRCSSFDTFLGRSLLPISSWTDLEDRDRMGDREVDIKSSRIPVFSPNGQGT
jgi:hypothetical protein